MPTPSRSRLLAALAGVTVTFLVLGSAMLAAERDAKAALGAGDPWPAALAGAPAASLTGQHVELYAADCSWCDRQTPVLRDLLADTATVALPLHVVVVLKAPGDSAAAVRKLAALTVPHRVSFVERPALEAAIGHVATPTHIVLDAGGRVRLLHRGYLTADRLVPWRARAAAAP